MIYKRLKDKEIRRIPREWEVVRLERIIDEIKNGFACGKRDENGIIQIRMNNVTRNGCLIFDSYLKVPIFKNINNWILKKGDFLFNNTNSYDLVGKSAVFINAPFPCTFSNHFTRIRFKKEKVLPKLILYNFLILWGKGYFKSVAIRHVGQSAVHIDRLLKLKILLPPLIEQKKIVGILSTIDHSIEEVGESISKTERLKKGLIQQLLTKGIGHKEFKETEIGLLPLSWVTKRGFIKIKSGFGFKLKEYSKKGIPLIRIDNIQYGKINYENLCYLPESYLKKYKDFVLKKGDIILALNRPITNNELKIGKVEIEPSILYQRVGILRIDEKDCNLNFYYHYLRSHIFLKKLKSILVGSDQPYIKLEAFSKISFPKPPLKEQEYIVEILTTFDREMELLKEKKNKLERVKKGLMNDLLSGRKRVRI